VSGRWLGAAALGLVAGIATFAILQFAGYLLYLRLWADSSVALAVSIFVSGAAGLYAGWILGMVVFSAIRGPEDGGGAAA
jgi:hypothetical protein